MERCFACRFEGLELNWSNEKDILYSTATKRKTLLENITSLLFWYLDPVVFYNLTGANSFVAEKMKKEELKV